MDFASIATAYAAFGSVLVGFAFAGLSIYVTRAPGPDSNNSAVYVLITSRGKPISIGLIKVSAVVATGFYAMASLGISTFLYANLSGASGNASAGLAETELLVYGVAFALSVLTLFYFMTLMLFESSLTRPAAKPAFWAGTIAGSIVVLRFLAGSAREARVALCLPKHPLCYPGPPYTTLGISITLLAAAVVFVVITLTGVLELRPFGWLLRPLADRPSLPSAGVFLTSVAVATLASLYLNALTGPPPGWFISVSYAIGIILIILFALASGSVIYPRLHGTRLTGSAEKRETAAYVAWWRGLRAQQAVLSNNIYVEYSSGFRPAAKNGHLTWIIPAKHDVLETTFNIRHNESPWHLTGQMLLAGSGERALTENDHCVLVALKTGCEAKSYKKYTLNGSTKIALNDELQPGASDYLQVVIRRLDSAADDILLCWLEAGGVINEQLFEDQSRNAGENQSAV